MFIKTVYIIVSCFCNKPFMKVSWSCGCVGCYRSSSECFLISRAAYVSEFVLTIICLMSLSYISLSLSVSCEIRSSCRMLHLLAEEINVFL